MAQLGDVFYTRSVGSIFGQQCINTYWYQVTFFGDTEPRAEHINNWVIDILDPYVRNLQCDLFTWEFTETMLYKDPAADYAIDDSPFAGAIVGESEPPFVSASFRSQKGAPSQRYGFKRFSGVSVQNVFNQNPANPAIWDAIATQLGLPALVGTSVVSPALVKRQVDKVKVLPPLGGGVNPDVSRYLFGDWTYFVGSQNSRKVGVGS